MQDSSETYVYHGSQTLFGVAHPRHNTRVQVRKTGEKMVVYEGVSFHATYYKWIAIAYTYSRCVVEIDGKSFTYTMGVDLYNHNKELKIYGLVSLEESLKKLYEKGGYVYNFSKSKFIHTEGLGNLELISQTDIEPLEIEQIDNPVEELKKFGVTFKFVDLSLLENNKYSRFYSGLN